MSQGCEPELVCTGVTFSVRQENVTHICHFYRSSSKLGNWATRCWKIERAKGNPEALLGLREQGKKLGLSEPSSCRICRQGPAELCPALQGEGVPGYHCFSGAYRAGS